MKILFFGSPAVAVPFLEACAAEHEVLAVVTQPDKPSGRGLALKPPAVKGAALRRGLRLFQPEKPSVLAGELQALGAEMAVVVAYGRILRPDLLAVTKHGFMNVHFSLLPKYRGAAPVQWTLIKGESETGVTLFWLDAGMDTGPVQRIARTPLPPDEDSISLFPRLVSLGVSELRAALKDVAAGRVVREPQRGDASPAPKLDFAVARIGFEMSAQEFHNRVRGLTAGPGAWLETKAGGVPLRVKVYKAGLESAEGAGEAGRILAVEPDGAVLVQCRDGVVRVREVQPEGKKRLPAADFINGLRLKAGQLL